MPDPIKPPPADTPTTGGPPPIEQPGADTPTTESPAGAGEQTVTLPRHPEVAFDVQSGLHFIRQAKRGVTVRIVASGNNGHTIHLNGMPLMNCGRTKPSGAAAVLKEGDVLAVKLGDRFDIMSLWMAFQTGQAEYLFETSDKWTAYLPLNDQS